MGGNNCLQSKPAEMSDSKKKILCIHGFRASPAIMEFQTSPLKGVLKDFEFVCMPGRIQTETPCDPMTGSMFPPPYYCNWDRDLTGGKLSEVVLAAAEDTKKFIAERGPFHAVIGFSQGAALAIVLAAMQQKKKANPLPVIVLVCGVRPDHRNEAPELHALLSETMPLQCPNIHMTGKMDPLLPRSEELTQVFAPDRQATFQHAKGHQFPPWQDRALNEEFANKILQDVTKLPADAIFNP